MAHYEGGDMARDVTLMHDGQPVAQLSERHPEHLFEVGYWQVDYGMCGIDQVLETLGVPVMWHLASGTDGGVAWMELDDLTWQERHTRAVGMLGQFKEAVFRAAGAYAVTHYNFGKGGGACKSPREALDKFLEVAGRRRWEYIRRPTRTEDGVFWPRAQSPLSVRAIINGAQTENGVSTATYIVAEVGREFYDWYIQALEIVVETCVWVLEQDDPEEYTLYWAS